MSTTEPSQVTETSMPDSLRFDLVDWEEVERWASLTPGQRIRAMLDARALMVGLIRGRLSSENPALSAREVNLLLLSELERHNG